jgi:hypothetical protein
VFMRRVGRLAVVTTIGAGAFVATAASQPLPLSARVIHPGELAGFVPGQRTLIKSAAKASRVGGGPPALVTAWKAALRRDGFKAMLSEDLSSPKEADWNAISLVEEFRSAAATTDALRTLARLFTEVLKKEPRTTYRAFPVNGIPGALGFHDTVAHPGYGSGADNILFANGPFLYLVNDDWVGVGTTSPPRVHLLTAAMKLYRRVRGHPAA